MRTGAPPAGRSAETRAAEPYCSDILTFRSARSARVRRVVPVILAGVVAGCGGGSSGPTPLPSASTAPGDPLTAIVFYDVNGNGIQDPPDHAIPDVEVVVGGRSGRSAVGSGVASLANVPAGSHQVTVRAETIPPFFRAGTLPTAAVPGDTVRSAERRAREV